MGINTKFNGGKQINRTQRGSFEGRCFGAGFCFQNGAGWHENIWQKCTGRQSGLVLVDYCKGISKKRKVDRERQIRARKKRKTYVKNAQEKGSSALWC